MPHLQKIVSSKVRAEILRLLFGLQHSEFHIREIARQGHFAVSTVSQDLKVLADRKLVKESRGERRLYYSANREHQLYPVLHDLVVQASGPVPVLRRALLGTDVEFAFIFRLSPRIEVLIVGDERKRRKLVGKIRLASISLEQDIFSYFMTRKEFMTQSRCDSGFVSLILREPRFFVVGKEGLLR